MACGPAARLEPLSRSSVRPGIQVSLSWRLCSWPLEEGDRDTASGPLQIISTVRAKEPH